ncbi:hypothetical protein [Sediminicola sp. 1XM1-17]|uniref:hypothetical protein n=1 Tax=Sediminicola sp. 1XM1-17 TaxID=3127702 RepID=UPI003076F5EE
MNRATLVLISILFLNSAIYANCGEAYSSATYALNHTKKSLDSNNFDHQMYYADRAIEALEKTKGLAENCGCDDSTDFILNGLVDLKKSADPEDWDKGRYFAQKAYEDLQSLINAFDVCTSSAPSINYSIDNIAATEASSTALQMEENGLKEQQKQLELQQQKILEQQRLLERKIEEQKRLAAEIQRARELEYEEQLKLKRIAEISLMEYEAKLKELATALGCSNPSTTNIVNAARSEKALRSETLEATRKYYVDQALLLQKQAVESLNICAKQ